MTHFTDAETEAWGGLISQRLHSQPTTEAEFELAGK